jgi:hypothetical protein
MAVAETCKNCGRPVTAEPPKSGRYHGLVTRATVEHEFYGCDTGCCGHRIHGYDARGGSVCSEFSFSHPDSNDETDRRRFCEELIADTFGPGVVLDWDESDAIDD